MQKKYIKNLFSRVLISIIIFLVSSIFINYSDSNLLLYKKYLYNPSFNFSYFNNLYNKYLGGILPFKNVNTIPVINENLMYTEANKYYDGVKLNVGVSNNITTLESGIIVFIGEKDNYGNTVIIQGSDGVDYWYGSIENIGVSLYDYVEKGNILGTTKNEYLYLVFAKNGEYLNYEEYI